MSRLGNYRRLAPIRARTDYEFSGYEQFEKILNSLAGASCEGCRGVNSRCPVNCKAKSCHQEKGVAASSVYRYLKLFRQQEVFINPSKINNHFHLLVFLFFTQ
ncbi:MAG: DUF3795 domain-containing protein [Syntrophomonadaceae bacterium]